MSSNPDQNPGIQVFSALTGKWIHDLPPLLSEDELLESISRIAKREPLPFKILCSLILERLFTFPEGSEFLMDDICRAFPGKNLSPSIYHLLNVLEGLGYVSKVKKAGTFVWFGPESDEAAKTFKGLKTVAIEQEGSTGSMSGDTGAKMTITRMTEEVLMIFLAISPLYSISMNDVFFLVFNREYPYPSTTVSSNMSRVFKVFEVLGIISFTDNGKNYQYTGPIIESHTSFEEIGKIEVDDCDFIIVKDDEVVSIPEQNVPRIEMVFGTDGSGGWIMRDYIPVSYDDKIVREDVTPGSNELESNSNGRETDRQSFGLVDVKDEIVEED